jgi:Domain of unknown function (DUF1330)
MSFVMTRVHGNQPVRLKQMTVVAEFDSYKDALAAYESADHKKALVALGCGVERDFRIAEAA